MIDSARRTVTELGLRHALLEVEHFAGIVELVIDDPAAAELHLRRAYNGFRRMGIDADTAETAALLARACLALGRDVEADEPLFGKRTSRRTCAESINHLADRSGRSCFRGAGITTGRGGWPRKLPLWQDALMLWLTTAMRALPSRRCWAPVVTPRVREPQPSERRSCMSGKCCGTC